MIITICIGSSCHLKGSREIVQVLKRLVTLHNLEDKVELNGSFCMGRCMEGVCVRIEEERFSLIPTTAEAFFNKEVLRRLSQ